MELEDKRTRVGVVFLDDKKRRVLPVGQILSFDMRFKKRRTGRIKLTDKMPKDGVFLLELPANSMAKPCETHLFMCIHKGTERLDAWVDDWLYDC